MNAIAAASELAMSSLEIAKLVESRHDKVRKSVERLAERGVIKLPPLGEVSSKAERGPKTTKIYRICKRDSYIVVAQLSPEFTARLVDRWQELEDERASNMIAMPDFSDPAKAARAWAEQYEARQLADSTKAEIGSRREATAMATASIEKRRAEKLAIELDQSQRYCTVKRMQMLHHGQRFNWRLLKATSAEMGLMPREVFDANYGKVKAYHIDVWREAYAIDLESEAAA